MNDREISAAIEEARHRMNWHPDKLEDHFCISCAIFIVLGLMLVPAIFWIIVIGLGVKLAFWFM